MIEYLLTNAAIFKYIWIDVDIASTNFKTNLEIACKFHSYKETCWIKDTF